MLRSSASRIRLVGGTDDLTLLVAAHLAVWGLEVDAAAPASGALRAHGSPGEAEGPGALLLVLASTSDLEVARAALATAGERSMPAVVVVADEGTAAALDRMIDAAGVPAPCELVIGVPRGRDLFEALESAVTSGADEVAARPSLPVPDP